MKKRIKIRVKSRSNLFIGGIPRPFEIGGIDQWTATDEEGFPCIPASTLKGALRAAVMDDQSEDAYKIAQMYAEFLRLEKEHKWNQIKERLKKDEEDLARVEKRYEDAIKFASSQYLFGIKEFNNTPKILVNDLYLIEEQRNLKKCFSIDAKTAIYSNGREVKSNPRTYKSAKAGLVFEGEIEFYRFDRENFNADALNLCRNFIICNLEKFNEGIYRIGNSKSRGYGKIEVTVMSESGEIQSEKL